MNHPFISPQDQWGMWTALFSIGTLGIWSEKTKIGNMVSASLVSILLGLVASNLGIIPYEAPPYEVVMGYLLPLSISGRFAQRDAFNRKIAARILLGAGVNSFWSYCFY
ncbi:Protein of unknown function DUF819 [Dillenia turbinata]|uniref:Uncharacterized protein n=1 Tax=Dillenia turbinata TaxID=194707 RepID=A0AAN8ZJT2_9MAGN